MTRHIGLVLLLGACASGLPLGPDVVVPGGRFTAAQGEADVVVRAFLVDEAGKREVAGARCDLVTSLYSASLTTPARVRVPNFGPQSPLLYVSCAVNGRQGAAQRGIVTIWRGAPGGYPMPGPLYGPWYGPWYGPGWYDLGPSLPVSSYPDVNVILR